VSTFEWFALGCGLVGVSGIGAIRAGWRPGNRLVWYALFVAFGLGLGTAIGRFLAFSIPLFLGLLALYFAGLCIVRRTS
jgi:hypothetical protein